MFELTRKFLVPFHPGVFADVTAITDGATVHAGGKTFEVCSNDPIAGGLELPISTPVIFRLTAKTWEERCVWLFNIQKALGSDFVSCLIGERGYWRPTDEYEDSWLITTRLSAPTPALFDVLYAWMSECCQEAVYLEYGGTVWILDREDIPARIPV